MRLITFKTAGMLVGFAGFSGRGGVGGAGDMFYPPLNHLTTLIANSANSEPNKAQTMKFFSLIVAVLAIGSLAATGLIDLYEEDPLVAVEGDRNERYLTTMGKGKTAKSAKSVKSAKSAKSKSSRRCALPKDNVLEGSSRGSALA